MKYFYLFIFVLVFIFVGIFVYNEILVNQKDVSVNKIQNDKKSDLNADTNDIKNIYKIIAFGDSLTAGYGVELKDSYPAILQERLKDNMINNDLKIDIINMGVSGETTSGGLDRVDFIISQNPDLVLLGLGANDMLRALDVKLVKENLEKIIISLQKSGIDIILLGMQSQTSNGDYYKNNFDKIYKDLSIKYDINLVPFFLEGVVLSPILNTQDGIHPNRKGYEFIIENNILPVLLPFLKKI